VGRLEYILSSVVLRWLGAFFRLLPLASERVVLASPRMAKLDGNLAYLLREMRARHPDRRYVLLLEPYGYRLRDKLAYLLRVVRGTYYVSTSPLVVVDNAYLPIHVAAHRRETTVVQVWHAVGAVKRFGHATLVPPVEPERSFLHRYYDYVIVPSEAARAHFAAGMRLPIDRALPLGAPRTDFFFDEPAMEAARRGLIERHPQLADRKVVLYAPTFRGRGRGKRAASGLSAERLRAALPAEYALVLKTHPNLDPEATPRTGYDLVADHTSEINDLLALAHILVTDYSSSIFEYALLRRRLLLLVPDLAEYARDPGLNVDYENEMIGTRVSTTDAAIEAIVGDRFDLSGYDAFIERHMSACDGQSSARVAERFLG
jgi:teichoic acid ribitol-phosphate primase